MITAGWSLLVEARGISLVQLIPNEQYQCVQLIAGYNREIDEYLRIKYSSG